MTTTAPRIQALPLARLRPTLGAERVERLEDAAKAVCASLEGRSVMNVNSTATGGGVAELLQTLLSYARGAGIDTQWSVITGSPAFFEVTKRIHNRLYGAPGDGGPLDEAARATYDEVMEANAAELAAVVRSGDVVILHDPQTAGLAPRLRAIGASVIWRCHVGTDAPNEHANEAWAFLRPYLEDVPTLVFSLAAFAPAWIDPSQLHVIPPSIDPHSPKNTDLAPDAVEAILRHVGLIGGRDGSPVPAYTRQDGSPARVTRTVDMVQSGPPPAADAPLVVQVSRWDRLKDMTGVLQAFAQHVDATAGAHLVLAGPSVKAIADDPDSVAVYHECLDAWQSLPHADRRHVHLACVPMRDPDEAAVIVNALQRHATVVTQKSLAEGFGLTVAEAMWKSRPVVATAVGGIVAQIDSGQNGLLVDDPGDLEAFGLAVRSLLDDPDMARRLGDNARRKIRRDFLPDRHLEQWAAVLRALNR